MRCQEVTTCLKVALTSQRCANIHMREADTCVTSVKSTRAFTASKGGGGRGSPTAACSRALARSTSRSAHHSACPLLPLVEALAAKLPGPKGHADETLKGFAARTSSLSRWLFMRRPVA